MKSKKLVALLSLAALLLSSCTSGGEGSSPAPDSPAATAEPASAEAETQGTTAGLTVIPMDDPMAGIDDSLSYSVELDFDSMDYIKCLQDGFKTAYGEKLSAYFEDIELGKISLRGNMYETGMRGWFTFTATPRPGSGIEPREQYCRSFNIHSENEGRTLIEFERSYPMEPAEKLNRYFSGNEDISLSSLLSDITNIQKVSGLVEAELYVKQLGNRYVLTDPEALEALALSLSKNDMYVGEPAHIYDYIPLYLRFEDGSTRLVLTADDGSNRCYVWDGWYAYMDGESIFRRFGVPLEAEGYEPLPGGGTVTTVHSPYSWLGDCTYTVEYSGQGAPVRYLSHQNEVSRPGDWYTEALRLYEYDAQGHRVKEEYLEDGELLTTITYEYSGDLLVRREESSPTGGGYYETYGYDELGRLIEMNSYSPDAIGGPISRSTAYWYDEDGLRHDYKVDENGNLVGYEDQPIRRPQY